MPVAKQERPRVPAERKFESPRHVGSGFIFVGPYQRRLLNLHHLHRGPPTTRALSFLFAPSPQTPTPRACSSRCDGVFLLVHQEASNSPSITCNYRNVTSCSSFTTLPLEATACFGFKGVVFHFLDDYEVRAFDEGETKGACLEITMAINNENGPWKR